MSKEIEEYLMKILYSFDNAPKDSSDERRASSKYLWDFFMKLLFIVGVNFCNFYVESLKIAQLKARWNQIKRPLSTVEPIDKWNPLIKEMNKIREQVEHDDFFSPEIKGLNEIRKQAPFFKEWILGTGIKYYQNSKNFTFVDYLKRIMDFYISQSEIILSNYGMGIPYVVKHVYAPIVKDDLYLDIPKLKKIIEKRKDEINDIVDIEQSDLESFIKFIELISKLNAWEDALLKDSICPACGGRIRETNYYSGGGYEDPPDTVHIRVGCEDCNYEVMTESIDI